MKKIAIIYGLGGSWLDPASGEAYLAARLRAHKELTVGGPFNYAASQEVHDFLRVADWRAIVGDSFGADYGPLYASEIKPTEIDYLAGFQPSMYANDVRNGEIIVPDNVRVAHCIRDPNWLDTAGLGYATWVAANHTKTKLEITLHRGAHPDDWGPMQDMVYAEILKLAGL